MERPVTFRNEHRLFGVLHTPEPEAEGTPRVGIVFVHGWTGYRIGPHRMFVNAARRFAEHGFHALRFDLRGRGDSEGATEEADLDGMISDVLKAREFLSEEAKLDRSVLLGICSGGNVTLGAGSLDKDIDGLVLWSTPLFAPFKTKTQEAKRKGFFLIEYGKKLFRPETYLKLLKGKIQFHIIKRVLFGSKKPSGEQRNPKDSRRDVMSDLVGYRERTVFIYGSKDDEAIGAPEFYSQFCEEHDIPTQLHTIEGANHSYYSMPWEEQVLSHTLNWLERLRDES